MLPVSRIVMRITYTWNCEAFLWDSGPARISTNGASVRAGSQGDALITSEPVPDGPAVGFRKRVAATDGAARGSAFCAPARQPHVSVQTSPQLCPCKRFVHANVSEPVCWSFSVVDASAAPPPPWGVPRTTGRWSASCRSAVTGQRALSDQAILTAANLTNGKSAGCFCPGDITKSIPQVRGN